MFHCLHLPFARSLELVYITRGWFRWFLSFEITEIAAFTAGDMYLPGLCELLM